MASPTLCCFYLLALFHMVALQKQSNATQAVKTGQKINVAKFGTKEAIHNMEHLKLHLKNKIDVNVEWNKEKQLFHYFSLNDLNKDQRIDGLEILKSALHEHPDGGKSLPQPSLAEAVIEQLVDAVLKDMDINNDGVIDYMEYAIKQQPSRPPPPSSSSSPPPSPRAAASKKT